MGSFTICSLMMNFPPGGILTKLDPDDRDDDRGEGTEGLRSSDLTVAGSSKTGGREFDVGRWLGDAGLASILISISINGKRFVRKYPDLARSDLRSTD